MEEAYKRATEKKLKYDMITGYFSEIHKIFSYFGAFTIFVIFKM